jgi:hypothetical protein
MFHGRALAEWWTHLVGALRVHPHKHCANYPPQKDRRLARGAPIYVRRAGISVS